MGFRWIAVVGVLLIRSYLRESFRKSLKCAPPCARVQTVCQAKQRSDGKS
jgi:hypothetical protein